MRAYKRLGLLEAIKQQGAITSGSRIFRFDGLHLHDLDEPALEEGLPATGGIMRPILHRIMQARVLELGVTVRLGITTRAWPMQRPASTLDFPMAAPDAMNL